MQQTLTSSSAIRLNELAISAGKGESVGHGRLVTLTRYIMFRCTLPDPPRGCIRRSC